MGVNLISACHKHKVKVFHFRSEENLTMMPFYYKHRLCLTPNAAESVETLEDQEQERDWMAEADAGGYPDDREVSHPTTQEYWRTHEASTSADGSGGDKDPLPGVAKEDKQDE